MIWIVLGIIVGISLIIHWGKKGAAWGGFTGGIIIFTILSGFISASVGVCHLFYKDFLSVAMSRSGHRENETE